MSVALKNLFESKKHLAPSERMEVAVRWIEAYKKLPATDKSALLAKFSLRRLAEGVLGNEVLARIGDVSESTPGHIFAEAVDPVTTTLFRNITENMLYSAVIEGYTAPEFLGTTLVTEETSDRDMDRLIGTTELEDDAMVVKEGEEFPDTKFGEDYIDVPGSDKRGLKIGVTREAVFFDRTGQLIERCRQIGNQMAKNKDKRIWRVLLGLDNTFKRKGVARNTYVAASDPRINAQTGVALTDWTSLDTGWQLFNKMRDDRTEAEPISVMPDTLLVSQKQYFTARNIINATQIETRTNTGNTSTMSANPVSGIVSNALTSPWYYYYLTLPTAKGGAGLSETAANARWYWGQPKKAFRYRTLFPMQMLTASPQDPAYFNSDIVAQFRVSERGVAYVAAPWYMAQFDA